MDEKSYETTLDSQKHSLRDSLPMLKHDQLICKMREPNDKLLSSHNNNC